VSVSLKEKVFVLFENEFLDLGQGADSYGMRRGKD
jgi:hypothetical protein